MWVERPMLEILVGDWKIETEALIQVEQMFIVE